MQNWEQYLQDPEQQLKRNKHPREAIRRQQEIREDIRLVGQEIAELTTSYEQECRKKKVGCRRLFSLLTTHSVSHHLFSRPS